MPAPSIIQELVDRFAANRGAYKSGKYNETQARQEFINPLFEALGWDVQNKLGYAETYKDVIHEHSIKIGDATKAPDYCFQIGGKAKFYLEAKKPAVNIKDDISPAYQLRRYAWSAKLPLSVLTDFEEFAVYDCRVKPNQHDKASVGRIRYLTFDQYIEQWDELAGIFSKEAVLKGSFDKYADTGKGKRGTTQVDEAFLAEMEEWRKLIATNLALRNQELDERGLDFAVQMTLNRIIFLRMCEDRGIETYGRLQGLLGQPEMYRSLVDLYRQADERYNSGLFHFQAHDPDHFEKPDTLTPNLTLDDKPLKEIIGSLYYPDSPYEFSVISPEILGQVYEQFLGKVIRLTKAHRAQIEDKPEVRKAGGVYYTPGYIVEYIVKNTVGRLLQSRERKRPAQAPLADASGSDSDVTPTDAAKLRILDPACGSGSFLLGAYQYLLDWHLRWYVADGPEQHAKGKRPAVFQSQAGWKLTTAKRKEILVNNIYGVDIDRQAVEVTKLSLLLKVMENESKETLEKQLQFLHERALPDLGSNIKCGNSLIGPDFYIGQQTELFDEETQYRINAFDWNAEFPTIMKAGGYDAVIGNPPYVRQESLADSKAYFEKHYDAFDGVADLYAYFMEKGVKLLRAGGLFSIIVSSSFLRATYGEPLRRTLKKNAAVLRIVDFGGLAVFSNAKDTYVCIPHLAKGVNQSRIEVCTVNTLPIQNLTEHVTTNCFTIPHERLSGEAWALKSDEEAAVFAKVMTAGKPLGQYVERKFFRGLLTGLNEAFEVTALQRAELTRTSPATKALIKPFLGGQDIRRYFVNDEGRNLIVIPCGWTRQEVFKAKKGTGDVSERDAWNWFSHEYPGLAKHLTPYADALRKRQDQGNYWWELRACDYYVYFDAPKIIFPDICKGPRFYLDRTGIYIANTAYCLGTDDLWLLGILNSRLFWFAIGNISIPFGTRAGQYRYRLIYQYMEKVPIRVINFADAADKSRHNQMVKLVDQMLTLHQQLAAAKTPDAQTRLERRIAETDRQIDALVYELYGLTAEEVRIVEGEE